MRTSRSEKVKRVCYPVNTGGSTWLQESRLVFVGKKPYAVLEARRRVALNPRALKHGRADPFYRYEGEIADPREATRAPRRA